MRHMNIHYHACRCDRGGAIQHRFHPRWPWRIVLGDRKRIPSHGAAEGSVGSVGVVLEPSDGGVGIHGKERRDGGQVDLPIGIFRDVPPLLADRVLDEEATLLRDTGYG